MGLGRRASWAMHGIGAWVVHGIGAWYGIWGSTWMVGLLGWWGGWVGWVGGVGPEHWGLVLDEVW